jgi:hypothetical protein
MPKSKDEVQTMQDQARQRQEKARRDKTREPKTRQRPWSIVVNSACLVLSCPVLYRLVLPCLASPCLLFAIRLRRQFSAGSSRTACDASTGEFLLLSCCGSDGHCVLGLARPNRPWRSHCCDCTWFDRRLEQPLRAACGSPLMDPAWHAGGVLQSQGPRWQSSRNAVSLFCGVYRRPAPRDSTHPRSLSFGPHLRCGLFPRKQLSGKVCGGRKGTLPASCCGMPRVSH